MAVPFNSLVPQLDGSQAFAGRHVVRARNLHLQVCMAYVLTLTLIPDGRERAGEHA